MTLIRKHFFPWVYPSKDHVSKINFVTYIHFSSDHSPIWLTATRADSCVIHKQSSIKNKHYVHFTLLGNLWIPNKLYCKKIFKMKGWRIEMESQKVQKWYSHSNAEDKRTQQWREKASRKTNKERKKTTHINLT